MGPVVYNISGDYSKSMLSPFCAILGSGARKISACFGNCRLYRDMQTVSICWIGPSKCALK
jgi:hypothetical protein